MSTKQMREEIDQEPSLVIHSEPATLILVLRVKKWLPARAWVLLARIATLWLCILASLFISSWTAWWMVNQSWVSPPFGGEILMTSWFTLSATSCGLCLASWARPMLRALKEIM
jgi:hypothetical protein